MPESKRNAKSRAKQLGFPQSNVVKGKSGYFIAPRGVTTSTAKRVYAECRSKGRGKSTCAKIAHSVNRKAK